MILTTSTLLGLLLGGGPSDPAAELRQPSPATVAQTRAVAEPPTTEVCVGDPAPNFAYQGYDGRWLRLQHLLDQGSVLLVIGASDAQLIQIEREREALLRLGVVPVAVVDRRPGAARKIATKLGLHYTVLADGRQVIAAQFNAAENGRMIPGFFVVDERGKVRSLLRGSLPPEDYPQACARALALPLPGTSLPASR
jgi:peroxiredoxin